MEVLRALGLSLVLHFIVFYSLQWIPFESFKAYQNEIVEIELIPSSEKLDGVQVVRDQLLPDEIKSDYSDDPIKFLSAQTQRVKEQSRALLTGITKNRQAQSQNQKQQSTQPQTSQTLKGLTPNYDIRSVARKDLSLEQGVSTIGEALPNEVSIGSFTALNTDRYLFYSFYSRVEELIRHRWEFMIKSVLSTTPRADFKGIRNTYITHLEIWLTSDGHFHSARLMKESGIKGFDQAAAQAFAQAKNFPNPPREMIESDGIIRLKYAFHVEVDPKVLADR